MKQITKLTEEQKAAMPAWAEQWIKIGLSCEEADWEASKRAIDQCYRFAGLEPPKAFIKVQSPIVLCLAAPIAMHFLASYQSGSPVHSNVRTAVGSAVHSNVRTAVGSAVWSAVWSAVREAVDSNIRTAVGWDVDSVVDLAVEETVNSAVSSAVRDAVWSAMRSAVVSAVREAVREAVWSAGGSAVRGAGGSAVGSAINANFHNYLGGNLWTNWPAVESFLHECCGLQLPGDVSQRAEAYRTVAKSNGWWFPTTDFVMVCNRPQHIDLEDGRLHSATRLAIQWRDGWGIAAWRGTIIPNEWILDKLPDAQTILKWENIEQRRAACEMVGWSAIIEELNPIIIDRHPNPEIGELFEVDLPDSGKERFLQVQCATKRRFVIPVPPNMKTALQASAWTYGLDNEMDDYLPEVRT